MTEQHGESSRPKGRSPSYPAIGLEVAIDRARQLYATERQHATPTSTIAHHWGYKSLNGPAALALAALKKFGLVEDEGGGDARRARLSDLAVDILAHPDASRRNAAIREAALRPPIHRELWDKYGSNPPSEATLHWELTRERGFTERGATEFIPEYRATTAFAQLAADVSVSTQASEDENDDHDDDRDMAPQQSVQTSRHRRMSSESARAFPIPLVGGATVIVEGEFPITEQDWAQFMAVLNAMKPGLVSQNVPSEPAVQHQDSE